MECLKILLFVFLFSVNSQITDSFNRKIDILNKPKRIIAIGAGALRMISYLNAVDLLCGVENIEVKNPKGRAYSIRYSKDFKKLPIIGEGGADKKPDYERIILLKPDFIIASSFPMEVIEEIENNTKIKVYPFDYGSFGSFKTDIFIDVITKLGKVLDREKRAKFLVKRINYYVSDLKKRGFKNLERKVYVGGIGFKGTHGITSTQYKYEPFSLVGVKSVIDEDNKMGLKHIFISKETLLKLNPDIVFLDIGGLNLIESDFKKDSSFYNLISGFKNNNIYTTLPFNFYNTNVEVVFINAYFIGKMLFPESFKDIDIFKICGQIMKDFLGKDVCREFIDDNRFYKKIYIKNGNFEYRDI
ncbi:MAG: ABC transporter substrate-binding protein [Endomicrobia bacterium]|nr:ABC transporter substrate-binding protein [Endomicrobiia bacterium]